MFKKFDRVKLVQSNQVISGYFVNLEIGKPFILLKKPELTMETLMDPVIMLPNIRYAEKYPSGRYILNTSDHSYVLQNDLEM